MQLVCVAKGPCQGKRHLRRLLISLGGSSFRSDAPPRSLLVAAAYVGRMAGADRPFPHSSDEPLSETAADFGTARPRIRCFFAILGRLPETGRRVLLLG